MNDSAVRWRSLFCSAGLTLATLAQADIIEVPDDFPTIQQAIDAAGAGDEIIVAPGTYAELIDLLGKAITLRGADGPETTIIDGQELGTVVTCANGEGPDTVLEGFTITGGVAVVAAGMLNDGASPSINNCSFVLNDAEDFGGAMANTNGAAPTLTDCSFVENQSFDGGAIYNLSSSPVFIGCTFTDNFAGPGCCENDGGTIFNAASTLTLVNCWIEGSFTGGDGGAMRIEQASSVVITDCMFLANEADSNAGGAIFALDSDLVISGSTFQENVNGPNDHGGAIYIEDSAATITDCEFIANETPEQSGGAIANIGDSVVTISNCLFTMNCSDDGSAGVVSVDDATVTVTDCQFIDNLQGAAGGGEFFNCDFIGNSGRTAAWGTRFENCVFEDNSGGTGGALFLTDDDVALNCTFANNFSGDHGGALHLANDPSVTDCTFDDNTAVDSGGAIYVEFGGQPTIENCTFTGNNTSGRGGAISVIEETTPTIKDCVFTMNTAGDDGGAIAVWDGSAPTVIRGDFDANEAADRGGAVYFFEAAGTVLNSGFTGNEAFFGGGIFFEAASAEVRGSAFDGNTAADSGGAVMCFDGNPAFFNCTFTGNIANGALGNGAGGAIRNVNFSDPLLVNCRFAENSASDIGGAMSNGTVLSQPEVVNCTFVANTAKSGGAVFNDNGAVPTLNNCILWSNIPDQFNGTEGQPDSLVRYSNVQGGHAGEGNLDVDPNFVDQRSGQLQLDAGSPCIDAGDNLAVPLDVTTDLANQPRFVDDPATRDTGLGRPPIVDMGAYEFQPVDLVGDLDGDGTVGGADLLILLGAWGPCDDCGDCIADLDADCSVGANDLITLLGNWS